jgi:antimicrobial peptide system SdpA family protein
MKDFVRSYFIVLWAFMAFFVFISLVVYTDDNPIKMKYHINTTQFKIFFPEGWAFFTKNAKDAEFELYKTAGDSLIKMAGQRQSEFRNLLGIKRDARSLSVEMSYLLDKIEGDSIWTSFPKGLNNCLHQLPMKAYSVVNRTKNPLLQGTVFVVRTPVVPWAWANSYFNIVQPVEVLKLNIQCQ